MITFVILSFHILLHCCYIRFSIIMECPCAFLRTCWKNFGCYRDFYIILVNYSILIKKNQYTKINKKIFQHSYFKKKAFLTLNNSGAKLLYISTLQKKFVIICCLPNIEHVFLVLISLIFFRIIAAIDQTFLPYTNYTMNNIYI